MRLPSHRPLLYLITEGRLRPDPSAAEKKGFLATIELAVVSGIDLIQIREKNLDGKDLFTLAGDAVSLTQGTTSRILINERFDAALAAGAHGVHLPSNAVPAQEVRQCVPEDFLIGVSTHNVAEVGRALEGAADFATFGPIYPTPGKSSVAGVSQLANVCRKFPDLPLIGLGGITETHIHEVLNAGSAGIAAIRMFHDRETLCRLGSIVRGREYK